MDFNIINIVKIIFNNAKLLFRVGLFAGIVSSLVVLFIVEPQYSSSVKFLAVSKSSDQGIASLSSIASGFGLNLPIDGDGSIISENIYPAVILSENLLEKILFQDFKNYHSGDTNKLIDIMMKDKKSNSDFERKKDALEILQQEMITVSKDPKNGVITISVLSNHKLLSRDLCNVILEAVNKFQQSINTRNAQTKKQFIRERILEVESNLFAIEKDLINFYDSHKSFASSPSLVVEQNHIQTQLDVTKSVYIVLKQELETAKIDEVNETLFIEVIDGPSVALYRSSPKRKLFVIFWTSIALLFSSIIVLGKDSKKFMSEQDLNELRSLKSILKNQFKK